VVVREDEEDDSREERGERERERDEKSRILRKLGMRMMDDSLRGERRERERRVKKAESFENQRSFYVKNKDPIRKTKLTFFPYSS